MKKRILSVLAVVLMATVLIFIAKNDTEKTEKVVIQPISIVASDITYEIENVKEDPVEIAIAEMQTKMDEIESIEDNMEWFIAYKEIVYKYTKWIDPPETVFNYFEPDEVMLICRTVETECYQQDFDSKCNVASVVFNRYYSGEFGDNIEEIITTPNQFAYGRETITEDTILAIMFAFEICDTTNGALYFHSNEKTETFNGADFIFQDSSGHNFYG